jgi:hypothetical protein
MLRFNYHPNFEGKHAFLGASKYHWVNYDLEKMEHTWANHFTAAKGMRLHTLAASLINERIRLPKNNKSFNAYVNDAIGFMMQTEQMLVYTDNVFGCADAISFSKGVLRIHDLKNGQYRANGTQLDIYAALFCLEYGVNPYDIEMWLRLYQNDVPYYEHQGNPEWIKAIMDKAELFNTRIEAMKAVMA